jgi:hypothetical protein
MEPTNVNTDVIISSPLPLRERDIGRQSSPSDLEHYRRIDYNGSPIPNIILSEDGMHCPGRIAYYTLKIIRPGVKLTKKKISIINPIGHLITKTWSNIQQEYMIDLTNILVVNVEITKEETYYIPEIVFRMKKGDDIRLTFETVDEARDCQLYLLSIISSL